MVTTGGTNLRDDIVRLDKPVQILVGTPGRVKDLADRKIANLSNCNYIVMDEADKLLSPEIQVLLSLPPKPLPSSGAYRSSPHPLRRSAPGPPFLGHFPDNDQNLLRPQPEGPL